MNESVFPVKTDFDEIQPPKALGEIGLQHFAPYLMNRIMGRYNQGLQEKLGAEGLSVAKMRTLAVLSVVDGLTTSELAVYAVIEQSTLSRTLDAMEAEGYIRRVADARDSRVRHIHMTDRGRELFKRIWPMMTESYHSMFIGIDADEHDQFVTTLQKILRNIRKHDF